MYGLNALQNVRFAGNSAGALIALCFASGHGWKFADELYLKLAESAIENGVFQKMSGYHDQAINSIFLEDPEFYKKVENKLFIGVTYYFDQYKLISKWQRNDQLRDCIHASMHIPYYCTHINKINNNHRAIDGGFGKQYHRFKGDTLVEQQ